MGSKIPAQELVYKKSKVGLRLIALYQPDPTNIGRKVVSVPVKYYEVTFEGSAKQKMPQIQQASPALYADISEILMDLAKDPTVGELANIEGIYTYTGAGF